MNRGKEPGPRKARATSTARRLRAAWQREHLDDASRALLARDSAAFLHQSVSTPCLAPIVKAEGPVHRGHGRPALHGFPRQQRAPPGPWASRGHRRHQAAARRAELRAAPLCAAARGGAGRSAGRALPRAHRPEGPRALHHRRQRRGGGGAEAGARRHRPLQDAELLGRLPRRRLRFVQRRRRIAVPLGPARAAAARQRACGALRLLPLRLRPPGRCSTASRTWSNAAWPARRWCATCWSAKATSPR